MLLVIFGLYTCSITFFTHSHIVGGVTIVHSHWYKTDAEGNPTHEHTGAEIQLIQALTTYFSFGAAITFFLINVSDNWVKTIRAKAKSLFVKGINQSSLRLRAPPVL